MRAPSRCCGCIEPTSGWNSSSSRCRSTSEGLVFCREAGEPYHPDLVRQSFERRVRTSAVPRIRFHDLRHTHATLMLQAGVPPKVVSERLGHATVAFTMDVYAHVIPGMQARAAETFGQLVFGDGCGEG